MPRPTWHGTRSDCPTRFLKGTRFTPEARIKIASECRHCPREDNRPESARLCGHRVQPHVHGLQARPRTESQRGEVMRLIRSLLFAPANRHDLLKKLPRYPADAVAIDLDEPLLKRARALLQLVRIK